MDAWSYALRDLAQETAPQSTQRNEAALAAVTRAAALNTGALEGLYSIDDGMTLTVASQAFALDSAGRLDGEIRPFFEAQLNGYAYVVDFATATRPLAEAWIRELHAVLCAPQETYPVQTAAGPGRQALPKGVYKAYPNHVKQADGTVFAYAPVIQVGPEMARLIAELTSDEFLAAHAAVQAAYAHYAFVRIHPFADGNGRVARALASIYVCRATSLPLLVLADDKSEYLATIRMADSGRYQPFVDFIVRSVMNGAKVFAESLKSATVSDTDAIRTRLTRLYVTTGGYTHQDVEVAANRLLELVYSEIERKSSALNVPSQIQFSMSISSGVPGGIEVPAGYRTTPSQRYLTLDAIATDPANAQVNGYLLLVVPRDCTPTTPIALINKEMKFEALFQETTPNYGGGLRIRAAMFAERFANGQAEKLLVQAASALRQAGLGQ